jgi:hypothetical protein
MTIKTSGTLAMTDIASEFGVTIGASYPVSLSQFYRGGSFVPNGAAANVNVPTSGAISIGSMYGASKVLTLNLTSSTYNFNLLNAINGAYGTQTQAVVVALTINSGVTVGASSSWWALDIGQFPAGSIITINNYGSIQGQPGAGGGYYSGGGQGGHCINAAYSNQTMIINNYSSGQIIAGGGGGGSGGAGGTGGQGGGGYWQYNYWSPQQWSGAGGAYSWSWDSYFNISDGYWGGAHVFSVGGQPGQVNNYLRGNNNQNTVGTATTGGGENSYSTNYTIYWYAIMQLWTGTNYTSGGAGGGGGAGGAGGHGTGYGTSAVGGAGGAAGAGGGSPGTNAGWGGQGGTGGTGGAGGGWGSYGGAGATGYTGNTGGAGNNGGGAGGGAGQGGAGGGAPGYYIYRNGSNCSINNSGGWLAGLLS